MILKSVGVAVDMSPEMTEGEEVDSMPLDAQTVVSAGLCKSSNFSFKLSNMRW